MRFLFSCSYSIAVVVNAQKYLLVVMLKMLQVVNHSDQCIEGINEGVPQILTDIIQLL